MKTKKAILNWWNEIGENEFDPYQTDLEQFNSLIDPSIHISKAYPGNFEELKLTCKRWKRPLYLIFTGIGECFKIIGF